MIAGVSIQRIHTSLGDIELFRFENHAHAYPRHAHDVLTLGVFGRDHGTIRVKGGASRAHEGAVLALAPDEVHSADPERDGGWNYRSLCPSVELAAHLGEGDGLEGFAFNRPVLEDAQLAGELAALHAELSSGRLDLGVEERLLATLRRAVHQHGLRRRSTMPMARFQAVERARAYLEARVAEPVRLAELAAEAELGPFQLIRAFRAAHGVPPHAYQMQLRAERARALLRSGEPITGVAFACGFVDQSHLTRVFKRIFGVTPGAYQKA